tara:strand:+ start:1644 stop:2348 length:705 start_codon:yes stop_codon:yes gene_type:complete
LKNQKVLAVVPARGGSKGIPRKNIKPLCGEPLIVHSIREAIDSKCFIDVLVTTDCEEISEIATQNGAIAPFIRPPELSHDTALATETIRHAVLEYESITKNEVEVVVMLQPTAPTRRAKHISEALKHFLVSDADSCISVVKIDNAHPFKMKRIVDEVLVDFIETGLENPPRQMLPTVYIVNGALYIVKRDVIIEELSFKGKKCLPYIMDQEESINIDSSLDFELAELVMKRMKK